MNPAQPFYLSSLTYPDRLAISETQRELNYRDFSLLVRKIAAWLPAGKRPERVGILGSRSIEACAGVLAASWVGATYVPISLKLPPDRLKAVLELSHLDALICDANGAKLLTDNIRAACPAHLLAPTDSLPTPIAFTPVAWQPADTAYIIFTSGTTGAPKGVMIPASALDCYVRVLQDKHHLTPEDRVAEPVDLSFDLSVSNMFTTWNAGASLHLIPATQVMAPVKFVQGHKLTFWFSVPSVITLMKNMGILTPGLFPTLRCSLFAGEALPLTAALAWREAAPNSVIDCTYGPTETTVICTSHIMTATPLVTPGRDIIAIGKAFPGTQAVIVDEHLQPVPQGQPGELALAGEQLATGYFNAPHLTEQRFRTIDGTRWYLSGDLAMQDADGNYHHLGRIDNQVKVLGYRVELEEIEAHLRDICGSDMVAAVAWPMEHGTASGIVAFASSTARTPSDIRDAIRKRLPPYMVPANTHILDTLPLNVNGKVDRKALIARLDAGEC